MRHGRSGTAWTNWYSDVAIKKSRLVLLLRWNCVEKQADLCICVARKVHSKWVKFLIMYPSTTYNCGQKLSTFAQCPMIFVTSAIWKPQREHIMQEMCSASWWLPVILLWVLNFAILGRNSQFLHIAKIFRGVARAEDLRKLRFWWAHRVQRPQIQ